MPTWIYKCPVFLVRLVKCKRCWWCLVEEMWILANVGLGRRLLVNSMNQVGSICISGQGEGSGSRVIRTDGKLDKTAMIDKCVSNRFTMTWPYLATDSRYWPQTTQVGNGNEDAFQAIKDASSKLLSPFNERWAQLTSTRWRAVWCKNKSLSRMPISQDGVAYGVK